MSFNQYSQTLHTSAAPSLHITLSPESEIKERLLIVDDSTIVRKLFADCLSAKYDCEEAESVMEAFKLLAEKEYSLVLTDMLLPGLSGIELLRKVVENYPYTEVIVASGVNQPQRALDAVRLGAFDYLIKPCELDVLELTVERALERRTLLLNARQYKCDLEARNNELACEKAKLERLQGQIIHSEKMASLGQLVAGIAHELNNPVGFIYGNLDILAQYMQDLKELLDYYQHAALPPEIEKKAAVIKEKIGYELLLNDLSLIVEDFREGAERIRDIVQNLRVFSRLDEAEFTKADINEGIESTLRLLSRYYTEDNITLVRDYGKLPPIDTFSGQLNQVWMNLLVNAAQSVSENGGEVRIETQTQEESVIVKISDTGCGIPAEHLSRIFDPFYTTKPIGEGTGLGLSISFSIIERHQGTIKVESKVNEGTVFTVSLPIFLNPQPKIESTQAETDIFN